MGYDRKLQARRGVNPQWDLTGNVLANRAPIIRDVSHSCHIADAEMLPNQSEMFSLGNQILRQRTLMSYDNIRPSVRPSVSLSIRPSSSHPSVVRPSIRPSALLYVTRFPDLTGISIARTSSVERYINTHPMIGEIERCTKWEANRKWKTSRKWEASRRAPSRIVESGARKNPLDLINRLWRSVNRTPKLRNRNLSIKRQNVFVDIDEK